MQNAKLKNFKIFNFQFSIFNSPSPNPLPDTSGEDGRAGFTLIELIIVLLIIGIAFGVVGIAVYSGGSFFELNTFVKNVSATLGYARSHAVAEKKTYSFVLWKDNRAFGLYIDFSDGNRDKDEEQPAVIYKDIPPALEAVLKNKTDDFKIDFFPQGNSSGGTVEIRDQKGKTFFIIVNKVTGRVEVKRSQNEK